jgi:hypothetical protein
MEDFLARMAEEEDVDESRRGVLLDSRRQQPEDQKWSLEERQEHLPVSGRRAKYPTTDKGLLDY